MTPQTRVQPRVVGAWARRRHRLWWRVPLMNPTFHSSPLPYRIVGRRNRPWRKHPTVGDHPQARVTDYLFLCLTTAVNQVRIEPRAAPKLAILKWRLGRTTATDRWQPVLARYVDVAERRVRGLGGDPDHIPPSPLGYSTLAQPTPSHENKHIRKVCGLRCNRFGGFEGFDLRTLDGAEHRFHARERRIEALVKQAWMERHLIVVIVSAAATHWPAEFILLQD